MYSINEQNKDLIPPILFSYFLHQEVLGTTIIGGTIPNPEDASESFLLLVQEL